MNDLLSELNHRVQVLEDRICTLEREFLREQKRSEGDNATASITTSGPSIGTPLQVLRLAQGWEAKFIADGIRTVEALADFIDAGKLVPGCFPRIGPEAVQKIKSAVLSFNPDAGPCIIPANEAAAKAAVESDPNSGAVVEPYTEGRAFALAGHKVTSNPHKRGTPQWASWDRGWQEEFSRMEADDEATREEPVESSPVPPTSAPPTTTPTLDSPAVELPEMDLGTIEAAPATAAPVSPAAADGEDDPFADL